MSKRHEQPSLFSQHVTGDYVAAVRPEDDGERARDAAIAQVAENADAKWMRQALAATRGIARVHAEFTTDRIWGRLESFGIAPPTEPRAIGAVMRQAAADGICEATDRTQKSVRPDCHCRPVTVWRSLVFGQHAETR